MKKIGLWVYPGRPADPEQIRQVVLAFREQGAELYTLCEMTMILHDIPALPAELFYRFVDCVVALGGDGTVLGAAMLGGYGAGIFESMDEAADALINKVAYYEPIEENSKIYAELFEDFKLSYKALDESGFYQKISEFQEKL